MVKLVALAVLAVGVFGAAALAQDARPASSPRILVAFFSKTGNTRTVAEQLQSRIGGDLFHVTTKNPYPDDYRETTRIARAELDNNERPELAATLSAEAISGYDVVFLGYPTWWGTIPMALFTFLEQHNLAGKTVVPFCTHGGSGLGRGPEDIAKLCPDSTVRPGFEVRSGSASRAGDDVANWLRQLGYLR